MTSLYDLALVIDIHLLLEIHLLFEVIQADFSVPLRMKKI